MADDKPTFRIAQRPTRRYPRRSGVEYEGETVFTLTPSVEYGDESLAKLVESVLERSPYRYGDWFDLPMPLYVVHDDETSDTFRVAVRDGAVELHVLPETESEGLRAFFERVTAASETTWSVACRTD